ncbi:MAG: cytochrome P450, partial [Caulobacteraceae bacterium]|nr:cytochrome P450 [Caulobacteraceae bacterium]
KPARDDPAAYVPDAAYEQPVVPLGSLFWKVLLVADPAGIKRVLVDNVANYPKTAMERRFFSALFGDGLLSTDGDQWRGHRRIMAPAFDPRSVAAYGPAMAATADAFLARWDALPDGTSVDISDEMTLLTLQIIFRTMFSTEGDDDLVALVARTMKDGLLEIRPSLLDLIPGVSHFTFAKRERDAARAFAPLDAAIAGMIAAREADPASAPNDLLTRLIAARDAETGAGMTAKEVRDQLITIFIAGHETTASAMTWVWYVLSQHPAWDARLAAELETALGGRAPTQDDLPALGLSRRIAEETMRLYPPAPGLSTRVALADDEICGVKVKKGAQVAVLPWVTQRHRAHWDAPERFDPDRFLPERSVGRPRLAYMPFGAGPRVCIGMLMAVNEIVLILSALARRYRAELEPGHPVALRHQVTLRPRHGMRMRLWRR